MIDDLIADLKRDEGFVPHVYDDASGKAVTKGVEIKGFLTIGYGQMVDVRRRGEIPKGIAEDWMRYTITRMWSALCAQKSFLLDLPEHTQRAVANMAYQMGVSGVLGFENMMEALERRDLRTAAAEALESRWAKQTPERAKRVAALMEAP